MLAKLKKISQLIVVISCLSLHIGTQQLILHFKNFFVYVFKPTKSDMFPVGAGLCAQDSTTVCMFSSSLSFVACILSSTSVYSFDKGKNAMFEKCHYSSMQVSLLISINIHNCIEILQLYSKIFQKQLGVVILQKIFWKWNPRYVIF